MANVERQTSGIGPGSKDDPFIQIAVPVQGQLNIIPQSINYPHEINMFKDRLFDIFEKLIVLRRQLEASLQNPSVKQSHSVGIKKSIRTIDNINLELIEIPKYLSLFSVDN